MFNVSTDRALMQRSSNSGGDSYALDYPDFVVQEKIPKRAGNAVWRLG